MINVKCRVKSCTVCDDKYLDLHHIIPKSIGTDEERIRLCKKHHDIIHKKHLMWIWEYIPIEKRAEAKQRLKDLTQYYQNNEK